MEQDYVEISTLNILIKKLLKKISYNVRITKHGDLYMLEKRYSRHNKWCATMKTDNFFAVILHKHNAWSSLIYVLGFGNIILKHYNRNIFKRIRATHNSQFTCISSA